MSKDDWKSKKTWLEILEERRRQCADDTPITHMCARGKYGKNIDPTLVMTSPVAKTDDDGQFAVWSEDKVYQRICICLLYTSDAADE